MDQKRPLAFLFVDLLPYDLYMIRGNSVRRAQAEALGGAIAVGVIMLILVPLILGVFLDTQKNMERYKAVASFQSERLAEKIAVDWLPVTDERYPAFWLNNTGTVIVELKTLFLIDTALHKVLYAINLTEYVPAEGKPVTSITVYPGARKHSGGVLTLRPGDSALFRLNREVEELNKITVSVVALSTRGALHPTAGLAHDRRLAQAGASEKALTAVMLEPKIVILSFSSLSDLLSPESPVELVTSEYLRGTNPQVGVVVYDGSGGYYVYTLQSARVPCTGFSLKLTLNNPFTAIIGYAPGSTDKYNILVSYRNSTTWYRVKVEGLSNISQFSFYYRSTDNYFNINTNEITEAIGFWYYANHANREEYVIQPRVSVKVEGSLEVKGDAERCFIYKLNKVSSITLNSYEPFLFIADTDGNGYGEVILVTEDFRWGSVHPAASDRACGIDEGGEVNPSQAILAYSAFISGGRVTYNPWNLLGGFTFRLKEVILDPRRVISVYVLVRVFYHDTEVGGLGECILTPYPIMRIMLVDDNWRVLASRDITYNELAALAAENTWPPNLQYAIISTTLAVPVTDARRAYVAVSILDPFNGRGRDDLDLTIGVEIIGVIPYARGD
ncbi:MAG: hypothetical protein QXF18_03045 [Acidilobaceae archaeon]